jgi:hypothetical protein
MKDASIMRNFNRNTMLRPNVFVTPPYPNNLAQSQVSPLYPNNLPLTQVNPPYPNSLPLSQVVPSYPNNLAEPRIS